MGVVTKTGEPFVGLDPDEGRDAHIILKAVFRLDGILTTPPDEGGALLLLCEMETCYCPKGRGCFTMSGNWEPTEEHVKRQEHHGQRTPGNIRLAHGLCNGRDPGWERGHYKQRWKAALESLAWHKDNPDESAANARERFEAERAWEALSFLRQHPPICPKCGKKKPYLMRFDSEPQVPVPDEAPNWKCPSCGHAWWSAPPTLL